MSYVFLTICVFILGISFVNAVRVIMMGLPENQPPGVVSSKKATGSVNAPPVAG